MAKGIATDKTASLGQVYLTEQARYSGAPAPFFQSRYIAPTGVLVISDQESAYLFA